LRYIFIDRIIKIKHNENIQAIKNVSMSEDVFNDHFIGRPIMPGALLIETMAQTGTALIEISKDIKVKALPIMVKEAKFRKEVRPGDQLIIDASIVSMDKATTRIEDKISVDHNLVMNGELVFRLVDAGEVYSPQVLLIVHSVYDVWLTGAEMIGFGSRKGSNDV